MTEAEIQIFYQPKPLFLLHKGLVVLLPIGAVYIIWTTVVIIASGASGDIDFQRAILLCLMQVLVYAALVGVTILSSDKSVFLSRDGISLPFFLLPHKLPRSQLSWNNLVAVRFVPEGKVGLLKLQFKHGKALTLNLAYLTGEEIEQVIVALDVWSSGADRFPALVEARLHLSGSDSMPGISYTNMWEEELARRFGATNFIPLEPQHVVRRGGTGTDQSGSSLTVERQLAFGGSSAIYLVGDQHNEKFVLKEAVIPTDADEELRRKSVAMLRREADYLQRLEHPSLSKVLDYFVFEDRHYLLMDHLEGIDLRRLVREKARPTIAEVIDYAKQIADIVAYLHAQDPPIVHRDLTPDNVILRDDGRVAVIDFGAANNFIGTATHTLIGKQAYMPPEQLRGKTEQRSDIYAFGATLHFLLTGVDPEPLAVSHPRSENADVPQILDNLVASCTKLELAERPANVEEVIRQLAELRSYAG